MAETETSSDAMELAKDIRQELMGIALEVGFELRLPAGHLAVFARAIDAAVQAERLRCLMLVERLGYAELLEKIAKGEPA